MVALARTLHPAVEFVHGDAEHLQFDDDSFDVVVANFAILHLGRPEQAAAKFARVLSPGGKVALSTWEVPAASRIPGVFVDAIQEVGAPPPPNVPTGPPFFRFADEAKFTGLLRSAGFVDASVSTVAFTYRYVGDLETHPCGRSKTTASISCTAPPNTRRGTGGDPRCSDRRTGSAERRRVARPGRSGRRNLFVRASRDDLILDVTAGGFTVTHSTPDWLWRFALTGAVAGALISWLITGWAGRRAPEESAAAQLAGLLTWPTVVFMLVVFAGGFIGRPPMQSWRDVYYLPCSGRPAAHHGGWPWWPS
jgi:hypothetical protein